MRMRTQEGRREVRREGGTEGRGEAGASSVRVSGTRGPVYRSSGSVAMSCSAPPLGPSPHGHLSPSSHVITPPPSSGCPPPPPLPGSNLTPL